MRDLLASENFPCGSDDEFAAFEDDERVRFAGMIDQGGDDVETGAKYFAFGLVDA